MLRAFYRSGTGNVTVDLPATEWRTALQDQTGVLWVDFNAAPLAKVEPPLRDTFGFHVLAIDDALREIHVPKIDDWGDYIYAVVHGVMFDPNRWRSRRVSSIFFLGGTISSPITANPSTPWSGSGDTSARITASSNTVPITSCTSCWIRSPLTTCQPLTPWMTRWMPWRPRYLLGQHRTPSARFSRSNALPCICGVLLARSVKCSTSWRATTIHVIDPKDRVFFRDVYDHLVRLVDLNETLRELTSGALDMYLSVSSNRINEVMKVLTIISALFMPISFVVGFFGMNF